MQSGKDNIADIRSSCFCNCTNMKILIYGAGRFLIFALNKADPDRMGKAAACHMRLL